MNELLGRLSDARARADACRDLGALLGLEAVLLFVKDPELGVLLPAPGTPKTLEAGPLLRRFLARCASEHDPSGVVEGSGAAVPAAALSHPCAVAVLVGTDSIGPAIRQQLAFWPLLAALLDTEMRLAIEHAQAAAARESARRADALVNALEQSRANAGELNAQLKREQARKDEFLAMLAHELRNPLAPIAASTEILRAQSAHAPTAFTSHLGVIARQVSHLVRLLDDLLDVSRVSRGAIQLRRQHIAMAAVLKDAVDAARPFIDARSQVLHLSPVSDECDVSGDRVRLTQVFTNLLLNASKYTDDGGSISVAAITDGPRVSIVVRDTGIGIPAEMLSTVFDLFAQVPSSLDRAKGGLGIGLTLAKTLVESHGGHISAHSPGAGCGSTFTVTLPTIRRPVGAPPGADPSTRADQAPSPAAVGGEDGARVRVLVVDDNTDAAHALAALVTALGGNAKVAYSAPEAFEGIAAYGPKLVLLDIGLPGMDGFTAARRLRDRFGFRGKLVAVSGYGSERDRERSRQAGFDEHFTKPLSLQDLRKLMTAARLEAPSGPLPGQSC